MHLYTGNIYKFIAIKKEVPMQNIVYKSINHREEFDNAGFKLE